MRLHGTRQIDRKFHITSTGEIADSDGNILPDDMPLFLLTGRDALAVELLRAYERLGREGFRGADGQARMNPKAGAAHQEAVHLLIADFIRWQRLNPDKVHVPQGSEIDDFTRRALEA